MNRIVITGLLIVLHAASLSAQSALLDKEYRYERSSLYQIMIKHPKYAYNNEIAYVFTTMALPERFNDHSLKVKSLVFMEDEEDQCANISMFMQKEALGQRMVSKWFGLKKADASFNVDLIKERGLYNASAIDVKAALQSARGKALLEDAGENLINDTYVIFHDIRYINKSTAWNTAKELIDLAARVGESVVNGTESEQKAEQAGMNLSTLRLLNSAVIGNMKGFSVNVTSYLYRLHWTTDIADTFYQNYYTDGTDADARQKVQAYLGNSDLFQMEYVGKIENKSSKTILSGVRTNEDLIRKVCTRALDKNIADLQHKFAEFRIKAPLVSVAPLAAGIGMKEDITEDSRFEVLERTEGKDGRTVYKRVGTIRPVKGKIWDNRFMAVEEGAIGADLNYTLFEKISGGDFYPGMLIREIR